MALSLGKEILYFFQRPHEEISVKSSWQRQFALRESCIHSLTLAVLVLISVIRMDAVWRVSPEELLQLWLPVRMSIIFCNQSRKTHLLTNSNKSCKDTRGRYRIFPSDVKEGSMQVKHKNMHCKLDFFQELLNFSFIGYIMLYNMKPEDHDPQNTCKIINSWKVFWSWKKFIRTVTLLKGPTT